MKSKLEIKKIEPTRANLRRFIEFQNDLYKGNRYYVPPFMMDEIETLSPGKNPAFDFCESEYFMAYLRRQARRPRGRYHQ